MAAKTTTTTTTTTTTGLFAAEAHKHNRHGY